MQSSRDIGVVENQAVIPASGVGRTGEPELVEGAKNPVPAAVSGEHSPGAVAPMRRRSQAYDQQPRLRAAKGRQGPAPVLPVPVHGTFALSYHLPVGHQPGAASTLKYSVLQALQRAHIRLGPQGRSRYSEYTSSSRRRQTSSSRDILPVGLVTLSGDNSRHSGLEQCCLMVDARKGDDI
jgi:hypothetical protein